MSDIEGLKTTVAEKKSVKESVEALIHGIEERIKAAWHKMLHESDEGAAITALHTDLAANAPELADAAVANTPAAPAPASTDAPEAPHV